jgi:hypothetical protein
MKARASVGDSTVLLDKSSEHKHKVCKQSYRSRSGVS